MTVARVRGPSGPDLALGRDIFYSRPRVLHLFTDEFITFFLNDLRFFVIDDFTTDFPNIHRRLWI